jgi:Tfp pilus assembly protein PilF/ribonuclease BN (tRNA processing enzyme)
MPIEKIAHRLSLDTDFHKLFWAARREHNVLKEKAKANGACHTAAMTFAKKNKLEWAKKIIECSRLTRLQEHGKALKILEESEAIAPESAKGLIHFIRGSIHQSKGELNAAEIEYKKAIENKSFDSPGKAWNNLGSVLKAKNKHTSALRAYKRALQAPNLDTPGNIWNNIGIILSLRRDFKGAIKAYKKALKDPNYATPAKVWSNIAQTYIADRKLKLAKDAFERALACKDPHGGDHSRARRGIQLLKTKISPSALSPDDRAIVDKPITGGPTNDIENAIITAILEAGDTQYGKYLNKADSNRQNTISILRGWSSSVTLLEGSERKWRGGGYFIKWNGYGIVIDPGFDFLRNFHDAGYHGREIHGVIVSHNHPDHNADLTRIDDLRYEIYKRSKGKGSGSCKPYVLLWDQDTSEATKFAIETPEHRHEPIFLQTFPSCIKLDEHHTNLPIRVTPFKAKHSGDVLHAMGVLIELLDKKGKPTLRIGYTGDTAYSPTLHTHLLNCDILIAHISEPTIDELQDASKYKNDHLGYRGTAQLIKECAPKLALIGEFWAGFTDSRIALVKGLRQRSGTGAIMPTGLAMHIKLPSLEVECTECRDLTPFNLIKIAPPTDDFGSLAYLCPHCLLH